MNEIGLSAGDYTGGLPVYFVASNADGSQYVLQASAGLETYNAADWTLYAVPMALQSDGSYLGSFPAVPNGVYTVSIYSQAGGSPATTDGLLAQGVFNWYGEPSSLPTQLNTDAVCFLADFGEPVVYKSYNNDGVLLATYQIQGVVNRNPPAVVTEDGKVLADYVEVAIANDPTIGVTTVNPSRDTIATSGRYGGQTKDHSVLLVKYGNAGMWTLRVG